MNVARIIALAVITVLLSVVLTFAAPKKGQEKMDTVSHGEFAASLVMAMGWEAGLPRDPKTYDYLAILNGNRTFRFEAEETYNIKSDNVVERDYPLFGQFTGRSWVSGIATPTSVHLRIFIPIDGEYSLRASSKGDGQNWMLGGRIFKVSTGSKFKEVLVGSAFLKAGVQEIIVEMPPLGGVDYIKLFAQRYAPIEPFGGWRIDSTLKIGDLAEISAALLDLDKDLPTDSSAVIRSLSIDDVLSLPETVKTTTVDYYGKPLSNRWGRSDYNGARLEFPFVIDAPGVYGVKFRAMGSFVTLELDGDKFTKPAKPYLDWIDMGFIRMAAGKHSFVLELPPNGGFDQLTLERKKSALRDYMELTGLKGDPSAPVKRSELDELLASLVERFKERR
jgi:hypothetical protein